MEKQIRVSNNITTLQKIVNYFRVQSSLPAHSRNGFRSAGKWSNSMYRVHFGLSGTSRDIDRANGTYPHYDHIGCGDSFISPSMYNKIHAEVLKQQSKYYVQVDEGQVDEVTDLVIAILEGSMVLYSMTIALWRTQDGYLFKDEDKVYLGPIFYNHENKGASVADWNVSGNYSFAEEVQQTSLNTQAKIQASNEVWGCYGIPNEPWGNMVEDILSACYLPNNMRWLAEHLFGGVYIDPQKTRNFSSVTLYPDSVLNIYSYDGNTNTWICTPTALTGYDANSNDDGATNLDNAGTFNDFVTYYSSWVAMISELFNHYPYLDDILANLQFNAGSSFDFTRKIQHNRISFIVKENITDLIESVAKVDANPEIANIYEAMSTIGEDVPYSVRDQIDIGYGETLNYADEVEISLDYSFEYMLKGKVFSERFAYFTLVNNNKFGTYGYHYLDVRICSDFGYTNYNLSIMYLNANLAMMEAVQTLQQIEMSSIPASGLGGAGVIFVPTVRSYYNALENVGNYANRAYDTFIDPKFQK